MRGFTFADAELVGSEASKAMTPAGAREVPQDMLLAELAEQSARIQLSRGRTGRVRDRA